MNYPKNIAAILLTFVMFKSDAQVYLRIDSGKNTFRFYEGSRKNVEMINDSVQVSITKKKDCYTFTIYRNTKFVTKCSFIDTKKIAKEKVTKRILDANGESFVKSERVVKILSPCTKNCIELYL